jgi:hypothetical protein
LGAVLLSAAGFLFSRHPSTRRVPPPAPQLIEVKTSSVSAPPPATATPAPILVQISADVLHVSAISLGHPRLAVINGRSVGEGDYLPVRTTPASVTVKLRVLRIADGRVDLTDGTQTISTSFTLGDPKQPALR